MKRKERAAGILERLKAEYPAPRCALVHRNAFQLLSATILSAQCTDERVNQVTPALFRRFPTPKAMAGADPEEVMDLIRSTGFFRNKTKSLIGAATRIQEAYGGRVPDTMEDLLTLPGVARKTANVVLGTWFEKNVGVVVDTHVGRLSRRMGLTRETDPVKVERALMGLFPRPEWTDLSHRLILHGRAVCGARAPACDRCVVGADLCPSYEPSLGAPGGKKKVGGKKKAKKKAAKAKPKRKTARGKKKTVRGKKPAAKTRKA